MEEMVRSGPPDEPAEGRIQVEVYRFRAPRQLEVGMITIIFVGAIVALLLVTGVFAFMAKDKKRKGQSGAVSTAGEVKQGRAPGLD